MNQTDEGQHGTSEFTYQYLPTELMQYNQWCLWRRRWLPDKEKWTKEPLTTGGYLASINNPQHLVNFATAEWTWRCGVGDGIGFVFTEEDPFVFLDLDGALRGGQWNPEQLQVLQQFPTWAELSVSGEGVHAIGLGTVPRAVMDHSAGVELYGWGRFVALTGWRLTGWPEIMADVQPGIDALVRKKGQKEGNFLTGTQEIPSVPEPKAWPEDVVRKTGQKVESFLTEGDASPWEGDRSRALMASAAALYRLDLDDGQVLACLHHHCGHIAREHSPHGGDLAWLWRYTVWPARDARPPRVDELFHATGADVEGKVVLNEDALALAFVDRHQESLRYCHTRGAWMRWAGTHWVQDTTSLAFAWARDLVREHNRKQKQAYAKFQIASNVERFARTDPRIAVDGEGWDARPWLLATPEGVVDLETGRLREARPAEHITRCTRVGPSEGRPRRWLRFLDEVTQGNKGLQRFMQQVAGYCLTGSVREHALVFLYGPGGNGKGVFMDTLVGVMGDYATTAPMGTFTASRHEHHPTELADLAGARLVVASETEEGHAWAESRIKQLTGGDRVKARFMRRDFFEYQPEFKLVFQGNHRPVLRSVDEAARRRFNLVPFTFTPKERDPDLREKLRGEYGQILTWMVEGCMDWRCNGLTRPEIVLEATRGYMEEQNTFQQWLSECTRPIRSVDSRESTQDLYQSWKFFCEKAGEPFGTMKSLNEKLEMEGFQPVRYKQNGERHRGFFGIRLATNQNQKSGFQKVESENPEFPDYLT